MNNFDFEQFKISKKISKQLKDRKWLKEQFASGRSAQEILQFSDENMEKFYCAARHLFDKEIYTDSANAFYFLVTLNPKNFEYWMGYGLSTQMCNRFEDAISAFEMAISCKMDHPIPYYYLARCLFAVQDQENALKALDLALEYSQGKEEFNDIEEQAISVKNILFSRDG